MKKTSIIILIVIFILAAGVIVWYFNKPAQTKPEENNAQNVTALIKTNKGDIKIELLSQQAPNTVANFVKLAEEGFYDNTKFHRVIKDFMIQGGDPLSKDDSKRDLWGTGGPGYTFADEIGPNNHNDAGTIAMANSGPNTNGSQFFINAVNNNYLDSKHTVFGRVTAGMNVVTIIDNVPTNESDQPIEDVIVNTIDIIGPSSDTGNGSEKTDLIIAENPIPNQEIASPLTIEGQARGSWFFEASFPVELYDENNNLIAQGIAQAQSDWMTEDFVSFKAELIFTPPPTSKGTLVLKKDNPSGLPEKDDELTIPVHFSQDKQTVNLYYYNPQNDQDGNGNTMCSRQGLVSVQREVYSKDLIKNTISQLLFGNLTDQERSQGITTEYPLDGFSLSGYTLSNGILTLTFNDPGNQTTGGACRVGILWFQIEATAKQFSQVQNVKFLPEDLFQP
jgi:cyclophilin family peptidyl-prolyl cis-trans isomerase